jgi:nitronate monooxygenase
MRPGGALHTDVCDILDCTWPIVQAGMGGVARAELVAAVAEAGGYGFLGMVREPGEFIAEQIEDVRRRTNRPFGVNLIPAATDPDMLDEEFAVCLGKGVHSICFFWDVVPELVAVAKNAGCRVLYQVGSVDDAVAAEMAGADIVIAQGFEAGGHVRGTVSSLVLLPLVVRAVSIPVLACGGFATGEGLVAALALGAKGIHCGTAFLATQEAFAHDYHKQRVIAAGSADTLHTELFTINWPPGSPVRVIANSLTAPAGDAAPAGGRQEIAIDAGRPIYAYSTDSPLRTTTGDLEKLAQFAGQVCGLIDDCPSAAERIERIVTAAQRTIAGLQQDPRPVA